MRLNPAIQSSHQGGASVVEFLIAAPLLFLVGLGTLQAGLLYHSKTILNYATFEAARVGATRHAMPDPMKTELGIRLAPLFGGNGTMSKAAEAMARSAVEVDSPVNLDGSIAPPTELKILNPTIESFDKWGKESLENLERTAIPNSHLKHQADRNDGAGTSALTLADANLLKISVTHGIELKVPFVNKLILETLTKLEDLGDADPVKIAYYQAGRIPLTSTATVRMQSEAWKESIELANAAPPFVNEPDPAVGLVPDGGTAQTPFTPLQPECQSNSNGLLNALVNPQLSTLSCPGQVGDSNPVDGGQSCV